MLGLTESFTNDIAYFRHFGVRFTYARWYVWGLIGYAVRNSCERVSRIVMNNKGLSHEPWRTPTFTLNFSLSLQQTFTLLHSTFSYMFCMSHTLKRKCLHFDEIFITGCTESCQNDNFQCSQWWKFHQNDDIFVSVWKLSKWQLPVQPVMKISSKWRHFRFSVHAPTTHRHQTCIEPTKWHVWLMNDSKHRSIRYYRHLWSMPQRQHILSF